MTAEELREALTAIPGVASAEVTERDAGAPVVRLWLDGTRPGDEVQRDVDHVITLRGYRPRPSETVPTKRGLGRGLETLLPVALEEAAPSHLERTGIGGVGGLAKLAIEESYHGVTVRAVGADGTEGSAEVVGEGERGLLEAVTAAVGSLVGRRARLVAVEERTLEGTPVVTVLVELADGSRLAGATVVAGGRPFTVGRAVHAALGC